NRLITQIGELITRLDFVRSEKLLLPIYPDDAVVPGDLLLLAPRPLHRDFELPCLYGPVERQLLVVALVLSHPDTRDLTLYRFFVTRIHTQQDRRVVALDRQVQPGRHVVKCLSISFDLVNGSVVVTSLAAVQLGRVPDVLTEPNLGFGTVSSAG